MISCLIPLCLLNPAAGLGGGGCRPSILSHTHHFLRFKQFTVHTVITVFNMMIFFINIKKSQSLLCTAHMKIDIYVLDITIPPVFHTPHTYAYMYTHILIVFVVFLSLIFFFTYSMHVKKTCIHTPHPSPSRLISHCHSSYML